jgi:hypothetical protein
MATHQCGLFYPLNALYLFMPTHVALAAAFVLHLVLGGIFTYLCARKFDISPYGSLLAAITFMFAGHITYHFGEPSNQYCATWTPLMLYLTKRICDSPGLGNMLLLAFFSSIQFMTGYDQHYLYTLYLMLAYVIFHFVMEVRARKDFRILAKLSVCLLFAGILTIGLSAVQLLPTVEMVKFSGRSSQALSDAQIIGLRDFLSVGTGFDMTFRNFFLSLLDPSKGMFSYSYLGLLPLILLPLTFLNKRQRARTMFLIIMVLFCFTVAMVDWGGWEWVLRVPTMAMFRVLYRILFIAALCFGLLAGIGWDTLRMRISGSDSKGGIFEKIQPFWWLPLVVAVVLWIVVWRSRSETIRSLYSALSLALTLAALLMSRQGIPSTLCRVGLVTALFIDLASGAFKPLACPTRTPDMFHRLDSAWEFLKENQDGYRSHFQFAHFDTKHMLLAEKYGQLKGIRVITDYEPLATQWLGDYMVFLQRHPFPGQAIFYGRFSHLYPSTARIRLLNLMSTRYFLVYRPFLRNDALAPGQEEWWTSPPPTFRLVHEERNVRIFENTAALPRARIVHNFRVIEEPQNLLHELDSPSFYPLDEVLLSERPTEEFRETTSGDASPPGLPDQVALVRDEPEYVEIVARSERPGFLILSDSYYPGWKSIINGEKSSIYRANYLFRAVPIDAGENRITFLYQPASFTWGMRITLASLAFLIGGSVLVFISSQRQRRTAS